MDNVPEEAVQDTVNMVGKQTADTQLTVTVKKTVMDSKMMYIHIEVQTNDGSPLQEFSQFRQSERGDFREAVLSWMGGNIRSRCCAWMTARCWTKLLLKEWYSVISARRMGSRPA